MTPTFCPIRRTLCACDKRCDDGDDDVARRERAEDLATQRLLRSRGIPTAQDEARDSWHGDYAEDERLDDPRHGQAKILNRRVQ